MSKTPVFVQRRRYLAYPPPNRVWEPTGYGTWTSRPWRKGEKEAYIEANAYDVSVRVS